MNECADLMIVVLWVFELQLLMQIIINRLSIVMVDKRKAFKLKWGVALCVTLINISVFLIWIPARLQINPT